MARPDRSGPQRNLAALPACMHPNAIRATIPPSSRAGVRTNDALAAPERVAVRTDACPLVVQARRARRLVQDDPRRANAETGDSPEVRSWFPRASQAPNRAMSPELGTPTTTTPVWSCMSRARSRLQRLSPDRPARAESPNTFSTRHFSATPATFRLLPQLRNNHWTRYRAAVMRDPEGDEFCLH